jgi:hypothetical protein
VIKPSITHLLARLLVSDGFGHRVSAAAWCAAEKDDVGDGTGDCDGGGRKSNFTCCEDGLPRCEAESEKRRGSDKLRLCGDEWLCGMLMRSL